MQQQIKVGEVHQENRGRQRGKSYDRQSFAEQRDKGTTHPLQNSGNTLCRLCISEKPVCRKVLTDACACVQRHTYICSCMTRKSIITAIRKSHCKSAEDKMLYQKQAIEISFKQS